MRIYFCLCVVFFLFFCGFSSTHTHTQKIVVILPLFHSPRNIIYPFDTWLSSYHTYRHLYCNNNNITNVLFVCTFTIKKMSFISKHRYTQDIRKMAFLIWHLIFHNNVIYPYHMTNEWDTRMTPLCVCVFLCTFNVFQTLS